MTTTSKKSKNFDRNLNSSAMIKQLDKNLEITVNLAGGNANQIVPLDKGNLRRSKKVVKLGVGVWAVTWNLAYAVVRFYKNNLHPQTTRWTERDYEKNGNKYIAEIRNGVIKK